MRARVRSNEGQILRPGRSVDEEAVTAACVPRRRSGSEESEVVRGRFSEANCGVWVDFGRPDFWVFLVGGLGARLWCWFRQAKS